MTAATGTTGCPFTGADGPRPQRVFHMSTGLKTLPVTVHHR